MLISLLRTLESVYMSAVSTLSDAYRQKGTSYGLLDSFFWPRIELWQRHTLIACEIKKRKGVSSILDVGGGSSMILDFIRRPGLHFLILDVDRNAMRRIPRRAEAIVGDGSCLPFKDNAVDLVISVATLEHIPKTLRKNFLKELERVARLGLLLYCPVIDTNGLFRAEEADRWFNSTHKRVLGFEDYWTAEHIRLGHPSVEELKDIFPTSEVEGVHPYVVWCKCALLSLLPVPILTGVMYHLLRLQRKSQAPYYACKIVVKKESFNCVTYEK